MKSLLGTVALVAAVLGGLTSCVQIEDSGFTSEAGKAYISFTSVTLDYEVEGLVPVKANVPVEDMPGQEDFTVRISGQDMEDVVIPPGSLSSEPVALDAGSYTVEAYFGSNGFDGPYFHKSLAVDLSPGQIKTVDLTDIPLANAMVALVLPEGIAQHLDLNSLQVTDGVTTIDVEPGQYVYAPSDKAVTAKFAGTNSIGDAKEISCSLGVLEPKHSYTVTCNLNLPSVSITLPDQQAGAWATRLYVTPATVVTDIAADKLVYEAIEASSSDWSSAKRSEVISGAYHVIKGLANGTTYKVRARLGAFCSDEKQVTVKAQLDGASVSASHTYSSSVLTGSKATANIGLPSSGILKTLHDAGLLTISGGVLKYGSTQVRTLSGLSGDMTVVSGWPYLPKGTGYTFEASHRCQGDTEDVKSSIGPIEVPAPTFTVSASAYTSYDKYLARDLDFANNHANKHTVFARQASVSISNDLLSNANYSKSSSITFNGGSLGTFDTSSKSFGDATGCTSWQNYPLVATMTFDGIEKSATKDCHITGLPYTASPPKNNGDHPWRIVQEGAVSYVKFNDTHVLLKSDGADPIVGSSAFNIPDTNADISVEAKYKKNGSRLTSYQFEINLLSGNNLGSRICYKDEKAVQEYTVSGASTFTPTYNAVSCRFESQLGLMGTNANLIYVYINYR